MVFKHLASNAIKIKVVIAVTGKDGIQASSVMCNSVLAIRQRTGRGAI
jgi:hypothetical protein